MENVLIKKGIKLSLKNILSIDLFLIAIFSFVYILIKFFEEQTERVNTSDVQILFYVISGVFILISIINLQQIFNDKPDLDFLKRVGGNESRLNPVADYYVRNGFKRPFIYFWPSVLFIAFLFYSTLPFIMESDSGYFIFILFWLILSFSTILVLYLRYNMLSAFLVIYDRTLVVRYKFKTYYIDVSEITKITYITKGRGLKGIHFRAGLQDIAKVEFTYLKGKREEIKEQLNRFDHIEFESKVARSKRGRSGQW